MGNEATPLECLLTTGGTSQFCGHQTDRSGRGHDYDYGHGQLRLIAFIKSEDTAQEILTAIHLPVDIPQLRPARPPPQKAGGGNDWLN